MQRRRRTARRPTRRLATVAREANRVLTDLDATVTEAYAPRGSDKLFLFKVRHRLTGQVVFSITSASDRCVGAETWLRNAKSRTATH